MENDRTLGIQHWGGYYRAPPLKGNLGLQLMSSGGEREVKPPFFSGVGAGGGYLQRECGDAEPSAMHMDFSRDAWYHGNRDGGKMLHLFQGNLHHHSHSSYGTLLSEVSMSVTGTHSFQIPQQVEIPREEKAPAMEKASSLEPPQHEGAPLKKKPKGEGRASKTSKPKNTKKAKPPKEDSINPPGRGRSVMKSMNMVINGINLDLLGIPTPVCTCTGQPQQCYRWGAGGWQSACCTTSISMYPLPMSIKRRGARIAGRKMSHGAFKKVLEKLAGDGEDFTSPIDLKLFWAKHGTNKFVTIR
ncbi:Protein Barley B recombinant [Platanthera zijinensis]|uniref:GAGA-binding transcriptional activator n=1 Tax=Platanthera zijinensis TaxID=2320716 RepID=A0AAP0AZ69_9ASPA